MIKFGKDHLKSEMVSFDFGTLDRVRRNSYLLFLVVLLMVIKFIV